MRQPFALNLSGGWLTPVATVTLLAGALSSTPGCTSPPPPPPPAALDRPESITFFCYDRELSQVVELGLCAPAAMGTETLRYALHGVVTQTTTGEVAAIQIVGSEDTPAGVIDTDRRVPGFTFAAVGDVPSAVVTPSRDPLYTFVVNRGSGELHVIETASFRTGFGASVAAIPGPDGGPFFPRGSRPTDMVLTPDERELVITLPELGEVWFVPIRGASVGVPFTVALAADPSEAVDLTAPGVTPPPSYEYLCGYEAGLNQLPPVPPRTPVQLDVVPRPWGITVDTEAGRVLVSDRSLPVIHVIDAASRAELAPIHVGVPTRDVVITPRVPSAPGGTERTERYLYAIDELDRSVLAVDYSDPARSSFGAVLTVSPTAPQDRLEVAVPARALEVASPRYSELGELEYCATAAESSPTELHGVFLTVGTIDGLVRVFDVFDLDTPCRGVGCAAVTPDPPDLLVSIGRHRPRVGAFVQNRISLDPGATWQLAGTTAGVGMDGTAGDAPPLGAVDCPAPLAPAFPPGGAPRVCAITDPWAAVPQRFRATWEGTIPFTATAGGSLRGDLDAIDVRFDPCALGILGAQDVPRAGYPAGYSGDVVAITGEVPPSVTSEEVRQRCAALLQESPTGETTPLLLPILSASFDPERPNAGRLSVGAPIGVEGTLDEVRRCYPELLRLEVRVRGAYLVESPRAGFRHPVVAGDGGRCEVDPARAAALERGRALPGQLFETAEVAFQVDGAPLTGRPILELPVGNVPPPLGYDISVEGQTDHPSLIARLLYNTIDQRLYVIDQARRGLVRMNLQAAQPIEAVFR